MASARKAKGKKSVAISDISGFKVPYKELKTTWEGFRVEPEEYDPKQPQLTPPRNVIDATALFKPRPDTDPENVEIYIGYTFDPFIPIQQRPGVGIGSLGSVGYAGNVRYDYVFNVTGVSSTGAIGTVTISDNEDVVTTGVAATGAVEGFGITGNGKVMIIATGISGVGAVGTTGVEVPGTDAVVTGVAATSGIGTVTFFITTDVFPAGQSATGAVGTEVPEGEIIETGVAATGATGVEVPESEITETGVAATGAIGTETINADAVISVTGTSATGDTGVEVGGADATNITGVAGTGVIGTEDPQSRPVPSGVYATGNIEGFGVTGNGNVQISATGVVGATAVGNVGLEEATSIVNETNNTGWGEQNWGDDVWGGTPEIVAYGDIGTVSIDIFVGPNPATGVSSTVNLGTQSEEDEITETGLAATGNIGNISLFVTTDIFPSGVAATGAIGSEQAYVDPAWGQGTWSEGDWGE